MWKMLDIRTELVEVTEDLAEILELAPTEVYNKALAIGLRHLQASVGIESDEEDIPPTTDVDEDPDVDGLEDEDSDVDDFEEEEDSDYDDSCDYEEDDEDD